MHEMNSRKQTISLVAVMLGAVVSFGLLSADEPTQELPATISQRQGEILDRIRSGDILEGVQGVGEISGPRIGRRGELVPDTLSILDLRFTIETGLKEHDVLVALQDAFLSRYFSDKQIKVISSELRYPGSAFSVIYYQDGWLGKFTLSLRDTEGGFEAWTVDHAQAQKALDGNRLEGIDVKSTLDRARDERDRTRRQAEERIRAARENQEAEPQR